MRDLLGAIWDQVDGLVQDCSNSIAKALELLQSCTKPLKYSSTKSYQLVKTGCSWSVLDVYIRTIVIRQYSKRGRRRGGGGGGVMTMIVMMMMVMMMIMMMIMLFVSLLSHFWLIHLFMIMIMIMIKVMLMVMVMVVVMVIVVMILLMIVVMIVHTAQ